MSKPSIYKNQRTHDSAREQKSNSKKSQSTRNRYSLLKSALIFISGVLVTIFLEKLTDKIHLFPSKAKWESKIMAINVNTDSSLVDLTGHQKGYSAVSKKFITAFAQGYSLNSSNRNIDYAKLPDEFLSQKHLFINYQVLLYVKNSSEKTRTLEDMTLDADSSKYDFDEVYNVPHGGSMIWQALYYNTELLEGLKEMRGDAPINFNPDETKIFCLNIFININPDLERKLLNTYKALNVIEAKSIKELIKTTTYKSGWGAKPGRNVLTLSFNSNMGQNVQTLDFSLYGCDFWKQMER